MNKGLQDEEVGLQERAMVRPMADTELGRGDRAPTVLSPEADNLQMRVHQPRVPTVGPETAG